MFSKEILDEVRNKSDLVEFLENRGISMNVSGANFVGLCPFHNERSPSFNVRPGIQRYHCFGCGEAGDIFSLVQHMESLSFTGAVQFIADEVGIQVVSDEDDEQYRQLKKLHDITKIASEFFHENFLNLPDSHPAKQNLADRELLKFAETDLSIGFAPNGGLVKLLRSKRFTDDDIVEAGLAKLTEINGSADTNRITSITSGEVREKFRNRLMWTIYDISGRPIGFSGRRIYDDDDRTPKYLNSPQTRLYNKSKALLGLNFARKAIVDERSVFIVEGQTDVMALQAAGIRNVVASCGTAFNKQHADILERLAATVAKKGNQFKFFFAFDPDSAGAKAAKSVFNGIPDIQLNSYVVDLSIETPDGMKHLDPCDLRLHYGDQILLDALKKPVSMVEFILKEELSVWDILTPEGRSGFINAARPTLALIKDSLAHDAYLRKISFWTGTPYSQLVEAIRKSNTAQPSTQKTSEPELTIDDKVYAAFLQYPELMTKIFAAQHISTSLFSEPEKADEIIGNLPKDSPLFFIDLKITEGKEQVLLERLLQVFLKVKYIEATDALNARIAAASNDNASLTDETMLLEIMTEQQALKVKYHQV
jgi:DNA primase